MLDGTETFLVNGLRSSLFYYVVGAVLAFLCPYFAFGALEFVDLDQSDGARMIQVIASCWAVVCIMNHEHGTIMSLYHLTTGTFTVP